ncbi:MAG: class I SAM-dependent methyltransferase [Proteobacteria bacterium]|nr:class I SAM-dependent methyltransferase [Pseudomonadota bacterium]
MDEKVFDEIDEYWSAQRNNEIYLKNKNLPPGSSGYFDEIEAGRYRYLYYLPEILAWFKKAPGARLLEVGCGMGLDLAFFVRHGFEGYGIDLAKTHVDLAKKYFLLRELKAVIEQGNAEKLDFPDESFDAVYSFGVLHHTPNTAKGINEIGRVLKPGGRAAVMLYHRHSLNNLVHVVLRLPYDNPKKLRPFAEDANFVFRFSKSEVRKMFARFEQVDVKVEYAFGAGWEPVYSWTPKPVFQLLSKLAGWHLVAYAVK